MKDIWYQFKQNKGATIGLFFVTAVAIIALLAPWLAPHDPIQVFDNALKVPPLWSGSGNGDFIFGTDDLGRDLFSRILFGARVSMSIGLFVVIFNLSIGLFLGLLAGSMGKWVDALIMRLMDIILALPSILLAIVVVAVLGPSLINTVIAVGIVTLPNVVRIVRASVLVEKEKNYVIAARSFGAGWFRIFVINVLPNCLAPLLVQASFGFSDGILNAAALGFLGLGAQPPTPEWGTMLSDSRAYIESASYLVTIPGACILIVVIAFNILGDGLRDALDPKGKKI